MNSKFLGPLSPAVSYIRYFFTTVKVSPAQISEAKTKAQNIINDNAVAVFSKSYCPYCTDSKDLLTELGARFYVMELDQVENGAAIQAALKEINGQSTVPNIYISQKHIGGNSDLQALKPKLPALLAEAGAL